MAQAAGSINTDYRDWEWSDDAGERARLLQSPSVEAVPKSEESPGNGAGATSALGAVFIVVNAALGAGLLNFPAAFNMAGGVAAGIALQMVRDGLGRTLSQAWRDWGGCRAVGRRRCWVEAPRVKQRLGPMGGSSDAVCIFGGFGDVDLLLPHFVPFPSLPPRSAC